MTIETQIRTQTYTIIVAIIGFLGSGCWLATEYWFLKLGNGYIIYPIMSLAGHIYILNAVYKKDLKKFGCALGFLILSVLYGIANLIVVTFFDPTWKSTTEMYIGLCMIGVGTEYSFFAAIIVLQAINSHEEKYNDTEKLVAEKGENDVQNSETSSVEKEESEKRFVDP